MEAHSAPSAFSMLAEKVQRRPGEIHLRLSGSDKHHQLLLIHTLTWFPPDIQLTSAFYNWCFTYTGLKGGGDPVRHKYVTYGILLWGDFKHIEHDSVKTLLQVWRALFAERFRAAALLQDKQLNFKKGQKGWGLRRLAGNEPCKVENRSKAPTWLNNRCISWPHLRDYCSNGGHAWLTISEVHHSHTSISSVGDRSSSSTAAKPALLSKTHNNKKKLHNEDILHETLQTDTDACRTYCKQRPLLAKIPNAVISLHWHFWHFSQTYSPAMCQTHIVFDVKAVCSQRLCQSPGFRYNWLLPKAWEKKNRRQKVIHKLKVRNNCRFNLEKQMCDYSRSCSF